MKKLLIIPFLFVFTTCIPQFVKLEIFDTHKILDGKVYSLFQFAQSSGSFSRSTLVFITSKKVLFDLSEKIPQYFKMKQEYTDVWILGIDQLDTGKLSESDKKIIDSFFSKIISYRNDNELPTYTLERLQEPKNFLVDAKEICKYLICGRRQN